MKTTVLQLESFDSRQSILDKMARASAGRVLLVWPKRNRLSLSEVDLMVIARKASQASLQLGLVSHSAQITELAAAHGINCFPSIPLAERARWSKNDPSAEIPVLDYSVVWNDQRPHLDAKKGTGKKASLWVRVLSAGLGGFALLALLVFVVPSAKVTLSPQTHEKTLNIEVWASQKVGALNVNGSLPLYEHTVELSGTKTAAATGQVDIPSEYATAEVVFTNLTDQILTIPTGTVVSTADEDPIRFVTESEVTLPVSAHDSQSVIVKALLPGSSGNVAAGQIQLVEGNLGGLIEVNNPTDGSGGTDSRAASPTEEDYEGLKTELTAELLAQASASFGLDADFQVIDRSIAVVKEISQSRTIEPGQPGEEAGLALTLEIRGLGYSKKEMQQLAMESLAASLAKNEAIYADAAVVCNTTNPSGDAESGYRWEVAASTQVGPLVDAAAVASLIAAKPYEQASSELSQTIELAAPPRYDPFLSPFALPWAEFRIQVEVQQ